MKKSNGLRLSLFVLLLLFISGAVYYSFAVLPDTCCDPSEKCCCAAFDQWNRPLRDYSCACAGGHVQWRECKYY